MVCSNSPSSRHYLTVDVDWKAPNLSGISPRSINRELMVQENLFLVLPVINGRLDIGAAHFCNCTYMEETVKKMLKLFPCFAVFAWWHTDDVVEYNLKIVRIVVSALQCNVGNGLTGGNQEVLRFSDTAKCDVLHWGVAADLLESV